MYVRNLPFQASEQDIEQFFLQAGSVEDVRRGVGPDGDYSRHDDAHHSGHCVWAAIPATLGIVVQPLRSLSSCSTLALGTAAFVCAAGASVAGSTVHESSRTVPQQLVPGLSAAEKLHIISLTPYRGFMQLDRRGASLRCMLG